MAVLFPPQESSGSFVVMLALVIEARREPSPFPALCFPTTLLSIHLYFPLYFPLIFISQSHMCRDGSFRLENIFRGEE
jgi:hypothetical protein